MKAVTFVYFILAFVGPASFLYGQDVKIDIYYDSVSTPQASSSGNKMVEYRGYNLQQVFAKVLHVPMQYVTLKDSTLFDRTVSVKIVTQRRISGVDLEDAFVKAVRVQLGLTVVVPEREVSTYVASIVSDRNLKNNRCLTDDGEMRRITQINRTWKGNCVAIEELLSKITEWSGESILNETLDKGKYNLEVNHSDLDAMIMDVEFNYGILISKETRKVKFIYVQ